MRKVIAISFTLLLLISQYGLNLARHYCNGEQVKTQLSTGYSRLDCGMDEMDKTCGPIPEISSSFIAEPCCLNLYQHLHVDDFYPTVVQVNLDFNFLVTFAHSLMNMTLFPEATKHHFANHSPPYQEKNIQVLFQTFLI